MCCLTGLFACHFRSTFVRPFSPPPAEMSESDSLSLGQAADIDVSKSPLDISGSLLHVLKPQAEEDINITLIEQDAHEIESQALSRSEPSQPIRVLPRTSDRTFFRDNLLKEIEKVNLHPFRYFCFSDSPEASYYLGIYDDIAPFSVKFTDGNKISYRCIAAALHSIKFYPHRKDLAYKLSYLPTHLIDGFAEEYTFTYAKKYDPSTWHKFLINVIKYKFLQNKEYAKLLIATRNWPITFIDKRTSQLITTPYTIALESVRTFFQEKYRAKADSQKPSL